MFVTHLDPEVTEQMLDCMFEVRYPSFKSATLIARESGFIRFSDEAEKNRAISEMDGIDCGHRRMDTSAVVPENIRLQAPLPETAQDIHLHHPTSLHHPTPLLTRFSRAIVPPILISERGDIVATKLSQFFSNTGFQGTCTTAIVLSVQVEEFLEDTIQYLQQVPTNTLREEISAVVRDIAAQSPWPSKVLVDGRTGTTFVIINDVWIWGDIEDPDSDVDVEDAIQLINGGLDKMNYNGFGIWEGVGVDGHGGVTMAMAMIIGVTVADEGRSVVLEGNETRGTAYSQIFH